MPDRHITGLREQILANLELLSLLDNSECKDYSHNRIVVRSDRGQFKAMVVDCELVVRVEGIAVGTMQGALEELLKGTADELEARGWRYGVLMKAKL